MRGKLTVAGTIFVLAMSAAGTDAMAAKKHGKGKARAADPSLAAFPELQVGEALRLEAPRRAVVQPPVHRRGRRPAQEVGRRARAGRRRRGRRPVLRHQRPGDGHRRARPRQVPGRPLFVATGGRLVALETGPGTPRELGSLSLRRRAEPTGRGSCCSGAPARWSSPRRPRRPPDPGDRHLEPGRDARDGVDGPRRATSSTPASTRGSCGSRSSRGSMSQDRQGRREQEGRGRKGPRNPIAKVKPRSLLPKSKQTSPGGHEQGSPRALQLPPEARHVRRARRDDGADGRPRPRPAGRRLGCRVHERRDRLRLGPRASSSRPGSFRSAEPGRPDRDPPLLDPGATTSYEASGSVPGTMLNQFSMSEHEGVLRVASTTERIHPRGAAPARAS